MQLWKNNAISVLSASLGTGDTTVFVQPSHGSRFPVVAAPNFAFLTLEDASGNIEIVKVTAHTSGASSMTVERAQQGTTAHAYIIGDLAEMRITALDFTGFGDAIADLYLAKANKANETHTGTHDFSTATVVALPANTTIGAVSATEISYLDGVTSGIQAQLAGKGSVTGQNWTGAHAFNGTADFSAGAISVATLSVATSDTRAASTAFVHAVAFSSYANLPGNPGDAVPRRLATYSGTVSWEADGPAATIALYTAGIV
jgi:hypothetical protein